MINRRYVFPWALYDFASSVFPVVIVASIYSTYYASVVVGGEGGRGTLLWGNALSVSAFITALAAPLLGAIADRGGARKRFMFLCSGVCIVGVALLTTVGPGMAWRGFILFVIANVGYESALVFYNSFLPQIASPETQGRVSGWGFGVGYAGSAIGLILAGFLIEPIWQVWAMVAVFYGFFSVPALVLLPKDRTTTTSIAQAAAWGVTSFREIVSEVWGLKDLRNFLIAFFFFINGVVTIIGMAGPVAKETFLLTDTELVYLFIGIQISALTGAFALAWPTDWFGPKRVVQGVLGLWVYASVAAYLVQEKSTFYALAMLVGFGLGAIQAASRSYVSLLIPDGRESELFGFYALCGKASSTLGPWIFGAVTVYYSGNQRPAFLVMTLWFFLGLVLLQRVPNPRPGSVHA